MVKITVLIAKRISKVYISALFHVKMESKASVFTGFPPFINEIKLTSMIFYFL